MREHNTVLTRVFCSGAAVGLAMALLVSCGGGDSPPAGVMKHPGVGGGDTAGAVAPTEQDYGPAPNGVEGELWAQLTAELSRVLATQPRNAAAAPNGEANAPVLAYSESGSALGWGYYSTGDYDQNGEVNISDLSPVALHFGKVAPAGGDGLFDPASIEAVLDGDGNGEINIADVTPIGVNFGVTVDGYNVYMNPSEEAHPATPDEPNGFGTAWTAMVPFDSATGGAGRLRFNVQVVPTLLEQHFWVRPYHISADGAASNYVSVALPPKRQPHAVLSVTGTETSPVKITWDASASYDSDGDIVRYEWDLNADGEYEYDSGIARSVDFYYYEVGSFSVGLRVTDDDGQMDTASSSTAIYTDATWHVNIADERLDEWSNTPGLVDPVAILDVEGQPGLFYSRALEEEHPVTQVWHGIAYARADDPFGESWPEPIQLPNAANFNGLTRIVDGRPAVVYQYQIQNEQGDREIKLLYLRAGDTTGSSWPNPTVLNMYQWDTWGVPVLGEPFGGPVAFLLVDGRPTILGQFGIDFGNYIRSNDSAGASWPGFNQAGTVISIFYRQQAIGGLPAILEFANDEDLLYSRALDTIALDWSEPVLVDQLETAGNEMRLLEADGFPAVVYYDDVLGGLKYRRALNTEGSAWGEMVVLDTRADGRQLAAIVAGRPAVLYGDRIDDTLRFIAANDAAGTQWGFPVHVASVEYTSPLLMPHFPSYVTYPFADVGGRPAFAHITSYTTEADEDGKRLNYVTYY